MNSAPSASPACCKNSPAPLRNTSVNASRTASATPGLRYSMTAGFFLIARLSSPTGYFSLAIRLLVPQKNHQEYATSFTPHTQLSMLTRGFGLGVEEAANGWGKTTQIGA